MIKFKEKYKSKYSNLLAEQNEKYNYKMNLKHNNKNISFKSIYNLCDKIDDEQYNEESGLELQEIKWEE